MNKLFLQRLTGSRLEKFIRSTRLIDVLHLDAARFLVSAVKIQKLNLGEFFVGGFYSVGVGLGRELMCQVVVSIPFQESGIFRFGARGAVLKIVIEGGLRDLVELRRISQID